MQEKDKGPHLVAGTEDLVYVGSHPAIVARF